MEAEGQRQRSGLISQAKALTQMIRYTARILASDLLSRRTGSSKPRFESLRTKLPSYIMQKPANTSTPLSHQLEDVAWLL
jgi:hypothetical protein